MKDIEIILINDFSSDTTINILKELTKNDQRIKIINNTKRMGTLYTRSIGILEAKGKYITFVDSDDMFCDNDIFDTIYEETEEEYYDIISFQAFQYYNNRYIIHYMTHKDKNFIGFQPKLGIYPFNESFPTHINNALIWGKMIRTDVCKAAVNYLGKERYSNYILWSEDTSLLFVIFNVAQSYKYIKKYGIYHYSSGKSPNSSQSKEQKMFGEVFNLDILFDLSKNEYKKYVIHKLLPMKTWGHYTLNNKNITKYFKSVIKKIMNCDYIGEDYKNKIRENYKDLIS